MVDSRKEPKNADGKKDEYSWTALGACSTINYKSATAGGIKLKAVVKWAQNWICTSRSSISLE